MPLQALSDGTHLHYESTGEGLPTLVPCLASSVPYERSFGEELKKDLRYVFVEARGTARSEGEMDVSVDRIADDLEDLRQQLGLERVAVLGQSRNGLAAARYAQKYPDAVEHLVVIGTPVNMKDIMSEEYWEAHADEERRRVAAENQRRLEEEELDLDTPEGLVRWFSLESHRLWFDPRYDMAHMWDPSLLLPEAAQRSDADGWAGVDLREMLADTRVPAFAAFGKYDFHVPPTNLLDDIDGVTVEVFDRSGHFPYIEEEQEFARRYRQWVGR